MMPGKSVFKFVARGRIEPFKGEPRGGEFGLAAVFRNDPRRKDRRQRRQALERTVGMPKLVGLVAHRIAMIRRHDFAIRANGGEDDEMRSGAERADFGHLGRAKAAREGKLALVRDILAAKHQNRIVLEGRAHRRVGGIMRGDVGQRYAAQFGAESRAQGNDFHRRILRAFSIR